jgi:hypothetical protein
MRLALLALRHRADEVIERDIGPQARLRFPLIRRVERRRFFEVLADGDIVGGSLRYRRTPRGCRMVSSHAAAERP